MEVKKYPNASLENYSKLLILLGLVLSLFIVYEFMQMKTFQRPVKGLTGPFITMEETEQIIDVTPIKEIKPPVVQAVIPDRIIKVDDEVEVIETIIESTETDENEAIIIEESRDIVAVEEVEEIVEDVPFLIIEKVPVFPGCSGTNKELKDCFSYEVTKFVQKKFNSELASDLGLRAGSIQKIFVLFKIDEYGNIINIEARAPHKKLKSEAIRVIKLLPDMSPGMQRGKPVRVSYSLPIVFKVD